jgi:hypothetical protein
MNNGPQVYSKRKGASLPPPLDAVYVGRPTKYGNPFVVGVDGNQDECVKKFAEWIFEAEQNDLREDIRNTLKEKDLVCWCKPLACHADVILEIANGH